MRDGGRTTSRHFSPAGKPARHRAPLSCADRARLAPRHAKDRDIRQQFPANRTALDPVTYPGLLGQTAQCALFRPPPLAQRHAAHKHLSSALRSPLQRATCHRGHSLQHGWSAPPAAARYRARYVQGEKYPVAALELPQSNPIRAKTWRRPQPSECGPRPRRTLYFAAASNARYRTRYPFSRRTMFRAHRYQPGFLWRPPIWMVGQGFSRDYSATIGRGKVLIIEHGKHRSAEALDFGLLLRGQFVRGGDIGLDCKHSDRPPGIYFDHWPTIPRRL